MAVFCQGIVEAKWFKQGITALILFAGLLVGAETYPSVVNRWGSTIGVLNDVILWIFILEILMKMGAQVAMGLSLLEIFICFVL